MSRQRHRVVLCLQAKGRQALLATTRGWERPGQSPAEPPGGTHPTDTLSVDLWPPGLRDHTAAVLSRPVYGPLLSWP